MLSEEIFAALRRRMVEEQLIPGGIRDVRVLAEMAAVPRHRFVPEELQDLAYEDRPLRIGDDQTISQPFIVAYMTQILALEGNERVLEVGTGSGYQTVLLARLARDVYSVELRAPLAALARKRLTDLGLSNWRIRVEDGFRGWPEAAPFDAIIVTAAPPAIPPALIAQLATGGRLVIPLGQANQDLWLVQKLPDGLREEKLFPVVFVPMTPESEYHPPRSPRR